MGHVTRFVLALIMLVLWIVYLCGVLVVQIWRETA